MSESLELPGLRGTPRFHDGSGSHAGQYPSEELGLSEICLGGKADRLAGLQESGKIDMRGKVLLAGSGEDFVGDMMSIIGAEGAV